MNKISKYCMSRGRLFLKGALVITTIGVAASAGLLIGPFNVFEEDAEAREPANLQQKLKAFKNLRREQEKSFQKEWNAAQKEREAKYTQLAKEREKSFQNQKIAPEPEPKRRKRQVRRFQWESPVETRGRLWNIPEEDSEQSILEGLLRICTSEQEGSVEDCTGIWQVLNNIRSRSCNRGMIRRITECDENGETMISVMRRAQRVAMGVVKGQTRRQRWISELDLTCEPPESYPYSNAMWERRHRSHCNKTVKLVRRLVAGNYRKITSVRIIAWGGRCEVKTGACDDRLACARGLSRVEPLNTANAFWCVRGTVGCQTEIDPVCVALGYGDSSEDSSETSL